MLNDTVAAINFLEEHRVDSVGVVGHSLGGTTAILAAANDMRVSALVAAAPLAKLEWDEVFADKAEKWAEQGYITFPSWKNGEIRIK